MTQSATTPVTSMMLERADRRHYGKVCGITQLAYVKGVTLNKIKSTRQEVVFKRSENEPEKTTQPQFPDVLPLYILFPTSFFSKLPHSQKVLLCEKPSVCVFVFVCVCV